MKLNFKTFCAVGSLIFGSTEAYFGICHNESLEVTGANQCDVAEFERADLFKNLKELKIDPNNVGVLITRFEGNGRHFDKESFPKLEKVDVAGSLTWNMIKQALEYLPTVSTLIIDPPNFTDKEDHKVKKYIKGYKSRNRTASESFTIPSCRVFSENGRIVITGNLKEIEDYKHEIYRICWESGISAKNTELMRSMIDAIRMEDKSKIQSLVKENPDLLITKFEGSSMYEKAVQFEKQDIAQLLTDLGEKLEKTAQEIYKRILKYKGAPEKLGIDEENIAQSIMENKDRILRKVSRKTSDLNLIDLLIELGADVNGENKRGYTPLFYTRNVEVAEKLIKHGADINHKNDDNRTLLTDAIANPWGKIEPEEKKLPWVKFVLKIAKDKINEPTKVGNTALHIAARFNYPEIAQMLIEAGANLNVQNKEGMSPLKRAVQFDSEDVVEVFFSKYSSKEIDEALECAIKFGSKKVGDILLNKRKFSEEQLENFVKFAIDLSFQNKESKKQNKTKSRSNYSVLSGSDSDIAENKPLTNGTHLNKESKKQNKAKSRSNYLVLSSSDSDSDSSSSDSDSDSY